MSYGVEAYLLPIELFKAIMDESNREIVGNAVIEHFSESFEEIDEMVDEDSIESDSPCAAVLDEFINDSISDSFPGFVYGYVFKFICQCFGEFLDNSCWMPCESSDIFDFPFESVNPTKFPMPDDFPVIVFIEYKNIDLAKTSFGCDNDKAQQASEWLKQSVSSEKDLVLFYQ